MYDPKSKRSYPGQLNHCVALNIIAIIISSLFHDDVTGHLCGEFTYHRWIPRTKAIDAGIWYFLWSVPE